MRAYSVDLREHVVAAVEAGRRRVEVADVFGISLRTVERYLREQQQTGDCGPHPCPVGAGRFHPSRRTNLRPNSGRIPRPRWSSIAGGGPRRPGSG